MKWWCSGQGANNISKIMSLISKFYTFKKKYYSINIFYYHIKWL